MSDPFNSARRRLVRARTHIDNLKAGIDAFMQGGASAIVTEPHYDGIRRLSQIKLKQMMPIPDELNDIAVEAIDGLRSALDHACFGVATKADAKSAYFPFADSAVELENTIKGRCKDIPPEIVNLLRGYKPYKGGDDLLWAFNKARHLNQHRILTAIGFATAGVRYDEVASSGGIRIPNPVWDKEKKEMVLLVASDGSNIKFKGAATLAVVFDQAGPLNGIGAVGALRMFAETVETIINGIEAAAASLNIFNG